MPHHLTFRPLLAALLLCSAQAAHLTVLDSPDPAQLRIRVSDPVALNVLRNPPACCRTRSQASR